MQLSRHAMVDVGVQCHHVSGFSPSGCGRFPIKSIQGLHVRDYVHFRSG